MLVQRPTVIRPVVAGIVVLLFTFPTYFLFLNRDSERKPRISPWWSITDQNGVQETISISTPTTISELPNPTNKPPELLLEAHKLPTADDFRSLFKGVTEMDGLSMATAKSSCTWKEREEVNFQFANTTEWAEHDRAEEELEFRRNQWHNFIKNELLPYELYKHQFQGRGIVILAGNGKSLKRVKVILRQLKRLGSRLPIEMHFWGDEFPLDAQKNISSLWPEVYFNDLSTPSNIIKSKNDNFFHVNYQLKTAAVINSRFAELLLLDSDNIPLIDPESLFESDTYKEFGTLFWPDISRTRPNNPMWAITNTQCRMDEYEQESGQLVVDKRRYFYHLQLAAWFNNVHTNYYYEFLLGDKDMFRFAWHALKTKFGSPKKWITSIGTLSPQNSYCGHTFAQHHPNGTIAFLHGGLLKTIPLETLKWLREARGGIFQAYKRSIVDESHEFVERVAIKMGGGEGKGEGEEEDRKMGMGLCTDMWDVHPRRLDEVVRGGFEGAWEEVGGYWMLDDEKS